MITQEQLLTIGFNTLPHFTIMNSLIYDLGRHRQLSLGGVGTPNEILFICNIDNENFKKITDIVCLHNYDYDGYITMEKIENLIKYLKYEKK